MQIAAIPSDFLHLFHFLIENHTDNYFCFSHSIGLFEYGVCSGITKAILSVSSHNVHHQLCSFQQERGRNVLALSGKEGVGGGWDEEVGRAGGQRSVESTKGIPASSKNSGNYH